MAKATRRLRSVAVLATAVALALPALGTAQQAVAAAASITIADPGTPVAGDVPLRGAVSLDTSPQTTSVLYAVDVSGSTNAPYGLDCNGDLVADANDNINNDTVVGDLLDCELAAVRALDADLASRSGDVQVALEGFAGTAATADLSPDDGAPVTFIRPGFTGGDSSPRIRFVTKNVVRNLMKKYTNTPLDSTRTSFDSALDTAIAALAGAPAGPRIVFLMSDVIKEGSTTGSMARPVSQNRLDDLVANHIRVRTFALGGNAGCEPGTSLARMAAATGESCVPVKNPATLQANVVASQPQGIQDVQLSVGGVTVAADVDAVGGWQATLRLGQGSYPVTATAHLTDGSQVSTTRTVTVAAAPGGTPNVPPPGTVAPSGTTLLAAKVGVRQPRPITAELPKRVRGRVAASSAALGSTPALNGATVLLQGRGSATAPWATVSHGTVAAGAYSMTWKRRSTVHFLRVVLQPYGGYDTASALVPAPKISNCSVRRVAAGRQLVCHTTAPRLTRARLLDHGRVVDRARVRRGLVKVVAPGSFSGMILSVDPAGRKHIRLHL